MNTKTKSLKGKETLIISISGPLDKLVKDILYFDYKSKDITEITITYIQGRIGVTAYKKREIIGKGIYREEPC